jgi:hypothetical protein
MKRWIVLLIIVAVMLVLAINACAQSKPAPPVTRNVSGQTLESKSTPAAQLEFDRAFKYVGAQSFVLYNVANAEQHFFVDADRNGRIKRFYWIQFEGYLPDNTHTYNYKSTKLVKIGGVEFIVDAFAWSLKGKDPRPDSDGSRARAFLLAKGFQMASTEVIAQRLVYMVDQEKRNELMVIYAEDLSGTGLTAEDLSERGSARARWSEMSQGLLERALKNMKVRVTEARAAQ